MKIAAQHIDKAAFSDFGDIVDTEGDADKIINQGRCGRFHDRARLDFSDGRAGVNLFQAEPRELPFELDMMERHPFGSQCFIPMSWTGFLIVVAPDVDGKPGRPLAFLTAPGQAVNFHRGTWHGVLTPLRAPGLFAVVDRIGPGPNLEEHWFTKSYVISAPP